MSHNLVTSPFSKFLFPSTTEGPDDPAPYTDPVTSRPEFIVPVVLLVVLVVLGVVGGGVYYKYNKR